MNNESLEQCTHNRIIAVPVSKIFTDEEMKAMNTDFRAGEITEYRCERCGLRFEVKIFGKI